MGIEASRLPDEAVIDPEAESSRSGRKLRAVALRNREMLIETVKLAFEQAGPQVILMDGLRAGVQPG